MKTFPLSYQLNDWIFVSTLLFWVNNWNLKNIKLNFELLARSRMLLETLFYSWPIPLERHQEKTSLFFRSPTKSNYPCIIFSYCSQCLFSKLNLLITSKHGTQNEICYFHVNKTLDTKMVMVNLGLSLKLLSQVKTDYWINFTYKNGSVRVKMNNIWKKPVLMFLKNWSWINLYFSFNFFS